jgi:hypothetical protein
MRIVLHLSVSSMLPPQFDLHDDKALENLEHPLQVIKRDKNWQKLQDCWESQIKKWISDKFKEKSPLNDWERLVLLGTCIGFHQRNLNCNDPSHQYIYPKILIDVQNLFPEFIKEGADPNHPDILNQVIDFGIQWVYYMDWDLYMSQELY